MTLTSAASVGSLTVQDNAELALGGNALTLASDLLITEEGTAGRVTSSPTSTITVGRNLDLRNATITGTDITGASGGVTLLGEASIARTLTVSGPSTTITFQPDAMDNANPMLQVGSLVRNGSPVATGTIDWDYVTEYGTIEPAVGSKLKLMGATNTLNGFTVSSADPTKYGVTSTGTSIEATWGVAPANTALPTLTAPAQPHPGDTLTCSQGTWTNAASYAYTWKRGATTITGQTGATYTLTSADVASTITCTVTATGAAGSTDASSAASASVTSNPPVNISVPSVGSGDVTTGDTLTCAPGTWTTSPTYTYAWKRGADVISDQSGSTYTVGDDDVDNAVTCVVTASNASGSVTAASTGRTAVPKAPDHLKVTMPTGTFYPGQRVDVLFEMPTHTPRPGQGAKFNTEVTCTIDGEACMGGDAALNNFFVSDDALWAKTYQSGTITRAGTLRATVYARKWGRTWQATAEMTISPLPDASPVFAKNAGTAWKTAGTADKLGVYTLPLTAIAGWTPDCESLNPGGKAIDTPVGKVGCTKDAITLVPTYPAKGENTWKGELTLRNNGASVKAPINLTVTADQAPAVETAPAPLAAANLSADGTLTCGTGSSVTNLSTDTVTQKDSSGLWGVFLVQFKGATARTEEYWTKFTLLNYKSLLEAHPTSIFAPFWQQRIDALSKQIQDEVKEVAAPTAKACTQDSTGAATTNPVLSTGNASLTADATSNGDITVTTANRAADTKTSSSREAVGTIAAAKRTKPAKRLNVPVAIVLVDRVGTGKKTRMKGITLQVVGLTNGKTTLKLRKRPVIGTKTVVITKNVTVNGVTKKVRSTVKVPKTITLSRHARLGIVMLHPIGKKLVPTVGTFPR